MICFCILKLLCQSLYSLCLVLLRLALRRLIFWPLSQFICLRFFGFLLFKGLSFKCFEES